MMRWLFPLLLALSGCVAPEEPAVRRPARAATPTVLPSGLQPAPMADRKMSAPQSEPVLQVDGMGKPKPTGRLPPL